MKVAKHQSLVETYASQAAPGSSIPTAALPDPWPSTGNIIHWDALFNHAMTPPTLGQPQIGNHDAQPIDLETWTSDFFGDAISDWIGWDSQVWNFNVDDGTYSN